MSTAIETTRSLHSSNTGSGFFGKLARMLFLALGYILGLIAILALGLPIVLLPLSTPVPVWIWLPLGITDVALIVLGFRITDAWRGITVCLIGMVVVSLIAVLGSQAYAMTRPITDTNGKPLPNSIAILEKVNLNGSEQWISFRGKDMDQPVLLFLAGGPGGSQLVTARRALGELEEYFVVVNWEQPGRENLSEQWTGRN